MKEYNRAVALLNKAGIKGKDRARVLSMYKTFLKFYDNEKKALPFLFN